MPADRPSEPKARSAEEQAELDRHIRNVATRNQAKQRRADGEDTGKRRGRQLTFAELPLFANERDISIAVMGPGRYTEWRGIVTLLEGRGFPKIDGLMGGRYTPAIRAFFDREYEVHGAAQVSAPHAPAELGTWKKQRRRRRG